MVTAIILIFVYVFYESYSVMHIKIETETAEISTVYEKIDAKALVIRDEEIIEKSSKGVTVPALADGDKINVGGNVAMTFSSPEDAEKYSQYASLQRQIKYYENLESQTLGQAASVESINSEVEQKVDSYIRALNTGNTEKLSDAGDAVNDGIVRRQMLIGENVDLVSVIQELRKQRQKYSSFSKPDKFIKTDVSGVFSSYTDGYEKLVDYKKAEELTIKDVESAINKISEKEEKENDNLGKLVTTYAWYLECVVDSSLVKDLENGDRVDVALKDNDDTVLRVKIIDGAEPEIGQKKTLLILKCSNMDSKLASMRLEDIEIRIKSYEGIKLPASALHVDGKKKGVYALISSQVKFREAEVIYSTDDYVMLNFDQSNPDGIRLYDKIITQGKGLKDGKVFT